MFVRHGLHLILATLFEPGFLNTVHKKPLRETTNPRQAATIVKVLVHGHTNCLAINLKIARSLDIFYLWKRWCQVARQEAASDDTQHHCEYCVVHLFINRDLLLA
jgi:hypothetical protein